MAEERMIIAADAVERIARENAEPEYTETGWYGETLRVKHRLNAAEMIAFVNALADNCFAEDGSYMPEAYEFTRRCIVLELYGNFALPEDITARYDAVFGPACGEAFETILVMIDRAQFESIERAARRKIDYRVNTDILAAKRELEGLVAKLTEMAEQFGSLFEGFSAEDAKGLIGALAKGVDEEKLMEAYVKQLKGAETDGA